MWRSSEKSNRVPFSVSHLADALNDALAAEALSLDQRQSPHGLDSLDEVRLHPVLGRGLAAAGYGVYPEQMYPQPVRPRRETDCERCDLVVTPDGQSLHAPWREPTLFDPPRPVPLDEAFWLEVKVIGQFTPDGPNSRYSAQLLTGAAQDVQKLSRNRGILHAGVLIVLFARDQETVDHDLAAWLDHCLRFGLSVRSPSVRGFEITDRLGNRRCSPGLYPVRPAEPS